MRDLDSLLFGDENAEENELRLKVLNGDFLAVLDSEFAKSLFADGIDGIREKISKNSEFNAIFVGISCLKLFIRANFTGVYLPPKVICRNNLCRSFAAEVCIFGV